MFPAACPHDEMLACQTPKPSRWLAARPVHAARPGPGERRHDGRQEQWHWTAASGVEDQRNSKVCIISDEEMLNHSHQQPTMRDLAELVLFMIGFKSLACFKGSFIFYLTCEFMKVIF